MTYSLLQKHFKKKPSSFSRSPIMTKGELVQVVIQILRRHKVLMSSEQPPFQQSCHPMNIREDRLAVKAIGFIFNFVNVTQGFQPPITFPLICNHHRIRVYIRRNEIFKTPFGCVGNSSHSNSPSFSANLFYADGDKGFSSSSTSPLSWTFSTDISFINLNNTGKPLSSWDYKESAKFMKPKPSSSITPQPKNPFQPKGTNTRFLGNHPPNSSKPGCQWFSRGMKYCVGSRRSLMSALSTGKNTFGHLPMPLALAYRTNRPLRPSDGHQVVQAFLF